MRLPAYVFDEVVGFVQYVAQELAGLLLFNRVECRSAISAAEQARKVPTILTEPIVIINKEHSLVHADQVGCHDQAWPVRAFDALFLEDFCDCLGRVENDITCAKDAYGRNFPFDRRICENDM